MIYTDTKKQPPTSQRWKDRDGMGPTRKGMKLCNIDFIFRISHDRDGGEMVMGQSFQIIDAQDLRGDHTVGMVLHDTLRKTNNTDILLKISYRVKMYRLDINANDIELLELKGFVRVARSRGIAHKSVCFIGPRDQEGVWYLGPHAISHQCILSLG